MKTAAVFFAIVFCIVTVAACSAPVPRELKLSYSGKRKINDEPGTDINAQRFACAERMLNLSPATELRDIDAKVVSTDSPVIIEVNAVLRNFDGAGSELPATYRCEYLGGNLSLGKWTRGLTQSSK